MNIYKEAVISRHMLTKGKKGKTKEDIKPKLTRLQVKRVGKINFK